MTNRKSIVFVWSVWAIMTSAALGLVVTYGPEVPFNDEFDSTVPHFTGEWKLNSRTIFRHNVNHCIAVPRLILVGLGHATDYDIRSGMYFNVLALSALSVLLIMTAKYVRGRVCWTDSIFPALFLNWGHYKTLLWSIQMTVGIIPVFSCIVLAMIVKRRMRPTYTEILVAGLCLLALPISQAAGVVTAPPLALWLFATGVCYWKSGAATQRPIAATVFALSAAVVVVAFLAYQPPLDYLPPAPWSRYVVWNSIQLLSMSFGKVGAYPDMRVTIATAGLLVMSVTLLLQVWRRQPEERLRAWGLLLFLGASAALALGIAWARPREVMSDRYPILVAPIVCGVYFTWLLYGKLISRTSVCAIVCVAVFWFVPARTVRGFHWARDRAAKAAAFERDVLAGVPIKEIVSQHRYIYPQAERMEYMLRTMHDSKLGIFRYLNTKDSESPANDAPLETPGD